MPTKKNSKLNVCPSIWNYIILFLSLKHKEAALRGGRIKKGRPGGLPYMA